MGPDIADELILCDSQAFPSCPPTALSKEFLLGNTKECVFIFYLEGLLDPHQENVFHLCYNVTLKHLYVQKTPCLCSKQCACFMKSKDVDCYA